MTIECDVGGCCSLPTERADCASFAVGSAGPSVFDLSVSGCPPAHSEGLGRAPKNKNVCCF